MELKDFLPHEIIYISSNNLYNAAFQYGQIVAPLTQKTLHKKITKNSVHSLAQAKTLLHFLQKLTETEIFVVNGENWLKRYFELFRGFCEGSNISLEQGAYLQSEGDTSCQTIFVKDKNTGRLNFIHIEENDDDDDLYQIHEILEKKQHALIERDTQKNSQVTALEKNLYNYRVVEMSVMGRKMTFFAYPGLCPYGAAFGYNETTKCVMAADTLLLKTNYTKNSLWASVLPSMLLDCGEIEIADEIFRRLKKNRIQFFNAYAIHLIQHRSSSSMKSYEFGAEYAEIVEPTERNDRWFISQTNFPRNKSLIKEDLFTFESSQSNSDIEATQVYLAVTSCDKRLRSIAEEMQFLPDTDSNILSLLNTIAVPYGDLYTSQGTKEYLGFVSASEAAYTVATFANDGMKIIIGKLAPPPIVGEEYFRFYSDEILASQKYVLRDLRLVASQLKSKDGI